MKNPLDALTDEQIRIIAENGVEWQNSVEPVLRSGTSGMLPCPRCQADASWTRHHSDWRMVCEVCDWNAAGYFGDLKS